MANTSEHSECTLLHRAHTPVNNIDDEHQLEIKIVYLFNLLLNNYNLFLRGHFKASREYINRQ